MTASESHRELRQAWGVERSAARAARLNNDDNVEWAHLERAHILSQPMALPHVRTHVAMLRYGIRRHDGHEILGQTLRVLVAGPGSLTGRYPRGNTGGANVRATLVMPIPEDLQHVLDARPPSSQP